MGNRKEQDILVAIVIVNRGEGLQLVKEGVALGLDGGIVSHANGLNEFKLFKLFSPKYNQREFVLFYERAGILKSAIHQLIANFELNQERRGVVFILKTKFKLQRNYAINKNDWNDTEVDHQLILMSLKHGKATEIVDRITHVSTAGATIFTGRSEKVVDKQKMMGISIVPQKDMVMSIVKSDQVPDVFNAIDHQYAYVNSNGFFVFSFELNQFSQEHSIQPLQSQSVHQMIVAIVSEELESEYVHEMKLHQINGGTSLKGFGSVSPEVMERLFNVAVNPQKKILMSVDISEKINVFYQAILNNPKLNEKHKGVYFILSVQEVYGLYHYK